MAKEGKKWEKCVFISSWVKNVTNEVKLKKSLFWWELFLSSRLSS